jgi:phosphoglycolate phosphatase-like HAD superfamily hydrolase
MSGCPASLSRRTLLAGLVLLAGPTPSIGQGLPADPLPSWREGGAKRAIVEFVRSVVTLGSPGFVPAALRIAVFDNDGTLWVEEPIPAQGMFALDRLRAMAARDPNLGQSPVYRNVLEKGPAAIADLTESDIADVLVRTHSGMTTDEFGRIAKEWLDTARHPRLGRRYKEAIYQPQLELLAYLRSNGFKTFLVSGGGIEFLRALAEDAYGIPPEQVVGSSGRTDLEMREGKPVLVKRAEIGTLNEGRESPSTSTCISGAARSLPSAMPTVTFPCSGGRQRAPVRAWYCFSTMTMPIGNSPTIASPFSHGWIRGLRRRAAPAGRSRWVIAKVEWHPGELVPRVGFIVTNLSRPAERVVAFYNQRGTSEHWIKEGKGAIKWTRLSCRTFAANAVRLQLHALAYNLGNFLRTLATPESIKEWSLTSLREKLIKIGAKLVSHGRYVAFQMAEVAVPRRLFAEILRLIAELRPPPDPAPA